MFDLKTILNSHQKFKSFVYGKTWMDRKQNRINVMIHPRKNSKAICSGCGKAAPCYDKLSQREFEHIPILGIAVFFLYTMRRVKCPSCGVKVEQVPWAEGKKSLTMAYMKFLSQWAKILPWYQVAEKFKTTWEKVYNSVEYVVEWGLKHRCLEGIKAIGVDEIAWKKNHKYLTLVYQIPTGEENTRKKPRLLYIAKDRTQQSFSAFFEGLGEQKCKNIKYVCSDMWKAYKKVIKEKVPKALHILDRFHIVANLNKALDKIRAEEHRELKKDGHEPLKNKRFLLMKRRENLTKKQEVSLAALVEYNLKSFKAYLLKEDFQGLWTYVSSAWAGKFIDRWVKRVEESGIEPMIKEAKSIEKHKELILNWFRAKKCFSSGIVEGLNNKAKVTVRKSYGFRTYKVQRLALYHSLGDLPEPPDTHRYR